MTKKPKPDDPMQSVSADPRRPRVTMAALALVAILAGLPLFLLAPLELGALRLGGVGLAWWYGGAGGELLALVTAIAALKAQRATEPRP